MTATRSAKQKSVHLPQSTAAWRTRNPGYLMYTATGLCIRDKLRVVHQGGFDSITDAQLALFHNIDVQGTRLTTIAERAGLAKQSMIELVNKSEKNNLVRRLPDRADKRAKIVSLTSNGNRLLEALHEGISFSEQRIEKIVGAGFVEEMKRELRIYADGAPNTDCTDFADKGESSERILSVAARRFALGALRIAQQNGYEHVNEALLALFRNLDLEGSRLTDIACRARMTKQSMRELVDRAATLGFVGRKRQAVDARAKIITFTPAGMAMLEQMRRGVTDAEKDLKRRTAAGFVDRLTSSLADYIQRVQ